MGLSNKDRKCISMFDIEQDKKIYPGEPVIVNKKTMLAKKPLIDEDNSDYFYAGVAIATTKEENTRTIICEDGYHMFYNPDKSITEENIGEVCYLYGDTVTMNDYSKIKAGIVAFIEISDKPADIADGADRQVWIYSDVSKEERDI